MLRWRLFSTLSPVMYTWLEGAEGSGAAAVANTPPIEKIPWDCFPLFFVVRCFCGSGGKW